MSFQYSGYDDFHTGQPPGFGDFWRQMKVSSLSSHGPLQFGQGPAISRDPGTQDSPFWWLRLLLNRKRPEWNCSEGQWPGRKECTSLRLGICYMILICFSEARVWNLFSGSGLVCTQYFDCKQVNKTSKLKWCLGMFQGTGTKSTQPRGDFALQGTCGHVWRHFGCHKVGGSTGIYWVKARSAAKSDKCTWQCSLPPRPPLQ